MALTPGEKALMMKIAEEGGTKQEARLRLQAVRETQQSLPVPDTEQKFEESLSKVTEGGATLGEKGEAAKLGLQLGVEKIGETLGTPERQRKLEAGEFAETETVGEDVQKSLALAEAGVGRTVKGFAEIGAGLKTAILEPGVPEEKSTQLLESSLQGLTDIIGGTFGAATSPIPALLPDFIEKPLESLAGFLGAFGDKGVELLIEASGEDPNSPTALAARENASTLTQLGAFKGIGKGAKVAREKVGPLLEKSAEAQLEKVLAPTKEKFKAKTQQVLPRLKKEVQVAATRESLLKKFEAKLEQTGQRLESFIEGEGIKGNTKKSKIIDTLNEAKKEFEIDGVQVEPTKIKVIDGLIEVLDQFPDEIPNTKLRNLRQIWDKSVSKAGRFDSAKTPEVLAEVDFKKMVTNDIRETLARSNPKLADINKDYSYYKNVVDVLGETTKRKTGQATPLGQRAAQAVGFVSFLPGGIGEAFLGSAALKGLVSAMNSTGWRTVSAKAKNSLADAIAVGDKVAAKKAIGDIGNEIFFIEEGRVED